MSFLSVACSSRACFFLQCTFLEASRAGFFGFRFVSYDTLFLITSCEIWVQFLYYVKVLGFFSKYSICIDKWSTVYFLDAR